MRRPEQTRARATFAALIVFALAPLGTARGQSEESGLPLPVLPARAQPTAAPTTTVPAATAAPAAAPASGKPTLPAEIDTGFDPKKDSPLFVNAGDYASLGGDCWGMSLVAVQNFLDRQKTGTATNAPNTPVVTKIEPTTPLEGDPTEHESTALAQADAMKQDSIEDDSVGKLHKMSDPAPITAALERIAATGVPELMMLRDAKGDGHATVLYGYKNGKLQIYDPNFPGETVSWPFDPKKGLSKSPKASGPLGEFYGTLKGMAVVPFDKFKASKDIEAIREACTNGEKSCTAAFPTIATKVTPEGDKVVVTGKVSGGEKRTVDGKPIDPVERVYLRINGKLLPEPVDLGKGGTYKVTLPAKLFGEETNQLQVIGSSRQYRFAGYSSQPVTLGPRKGLVDAINGSH